MVIIKSVEIRNFRSIVKIASDFHPNHLNIIVGQNDIGKSNILKALNLFFNWQTEIGNPFRFRDDFSHYATTPNKKAKEVIIKVTFNVPSRFKDKEEIIWTKVWREHGFDNNQEEIITRSGKKLSGKSGAIRWVRMVKFKYVPAIRGNEYFGHLMGNLHDALSEISPDVFNEASKKFIESLKKQVEILVNEISSKLGYTSQISTPSDFRTLFSTLDFGLEKDGTTISLNKRGDGIKAQHIPIILKFIANHYKSVSGRGNIAPDTIWGFEEPENNMEMTNAFKLAKIFAIYADDIQIFLNTHSPAFYLLAQDFAEKTSLYLVKTEGTERRDTKLLAIKNDEIPLLDEEVGILPIISGYIKNEVESRNQVEVKAKELESQIALITKPVLVTEGKTDVIILKTAWSKLYPTQDRGFEIISSDNRTDNSGGSGGYSSLDKLIESVRPDGKIHIALYDKDTAGIKGFDNLSKNFGDKKIQEIIVKAHQNEKAFAILLPEVDGYTKNFADAENLQIEFYFDEADFRKDIEGKGLIVNKRKAEMKAHGSGKVIEVKEIDEVSFGVIDSNTKTYFAETIVPTLNRESFQRFEKLFTMIEEILPV